MTKTKIVKTDDQDLGFNKKLKNEKFDNLFDNTTIQNAEKVVERSKDDFLKATLEDFEELKQGVLNLASSSDPTLVDVIQNKAFSVKSRAATGGYPLASDVAKSLFEFCEKLDETKYNVIKLHIAALEQIFSGKFDSKDKEKSQKLLSGLHQLVAKNAK
jgi:replicative DNA helicase